MRAIRALIPGVTGQNGAYLSKLMIDQGYEVHGLLRRSASAGSASPTRYSCTMATSRIRVLNGVRAAEVLQSDGSILRQIVVAAAVVADPSTKKTPAISETVVCR
jgi:GDP-D-mannose dehydratase